jgi:osmotically-inducible protein OsmY
MQKKCAPNGRPNAFRAFVRSPTLAETFKRSAEIDADHIEIEVAGDRVILRGKVRSWNEHEDAGQAARSLPGVKHVENMTYVG